MDICSLPQLIAACHVLLRLLVPRHPPCALLHLTKSVAWWRSSGLLQLFVIQLLVNYLLVFLIQLTSINRYPLSLTEKLIFFDFRCLLLLHFDTLFSFQGTFFTLSGWWRIRGSNPWPPACKAGALPAELIPHKTHSARFSSSLERRWSSRSFSNGYLVTTSPQSLVLP